jgi:t-SNARE complex subunit (syntaxin)
VAAGVDASAAQTGLVKSKFVEAIQSYQQVEQQYRQRYKQRLERQYKIGACYSSAASGPTMC